MKKVLLMAAVCLVAKAEVDVEAGKRAEKTYCVACHSTRLIESQRLSAAAWGKELDKMAGWGAVVPARQILLDYLASEYSNTKPVPMPATSVNGAGMGKGQTGR